MAHCRWHSCIATKLSAGAGNPDITPVHEVLTRTITAPEGESGAAWPPACRALSARNAIRRRMPRAAAPEPVDTSAGNGSCGIMASSSCGRPWRSGAARPRSRQTGARPRASSDVPDRAPYSRSGKQGAGWGTWTRAIGQKSLKGASPARRAARHPSDHRPKPRHDLPSLRRPGPAAASPSRRGEASASARRPAGIDGMPPCRIVAAIVLKHLALVTVRGMPARRFGPVRGDLTAGAPTLAGQIEPGGR